jgi:predicted O-linked N-acetylglucosamine transferase (SPINDLY family)
MNKRLQRARELVAQQQFDEAQAICRTEIKLRRDVVAARKLLAIAIYGRSVPLLAHGEFHADVEALLREALGFDPDNADALNNLGALLLKTHRPGEALPLLERHLRLAKDQVRALENLALAQQECGDLQSASACLKQLADISPADNALYLVREALLFPVVPDSAEALLAAREALAAKLAALLARDDLRGRDPLRFPSTYFPLTYHGMPNPDINRAIAQIYARACPSLTWEAPQVAAWQGPRQRIKVGVVSAFLHDHSVGKICAGIFEKIDKSRFELVAIRLQPSPHDPIARAIDGAADEVIDLSGHDLETARKAIAGLQPDILFYQDIGMEPMSYFLAMARLAPVQMTWFGHPDTTGIANMDYFLSWENFETADSPLHYTEQLVLSQARGNIANYHRPAGEDKSLTRASFGFAAEDHLYCCAQQAYKLMPVMDRLFDEVVRRDPRAIIVLFEPLQTHLREAVEQRMRTHSPNLLARLRYLPMQGYAAYLRVLQLSDVVLDTAPFNGYNTTLDAFAMGTPVVTLAGKTMRDRFGCGLYQAIGLAELVADGEADYVELAVRLAEDPSFRESCQFRIAAGCSTLFEDISAVRGIEELIAKVVDMRSAP